MYQMKMLSHNRLQTDQQTDRVSDQLLELLEWLFATKKEQLLLFVPDVSKEEKVSSYRRLTRSFWMTSVELLK